MPLPSLPPRHRASALRVDQVTGVKLTARVILFLALSTVVVFAAFNSTLVTIDALFGGVTLPLGVALVSFFALGSLAGALGLYLAVVLRLKRALRRTRGSGS